MKPATRRRVENCAATGLVFVAVGLRAGLWIADHAAVLLPKVTPRRLWELQRQAKRAARQAAKSAGIATDERTEGINLQQQERAA